MAQTKRKKKDTFRTFERLMTRVILGTLVLFLLMMAASSVGIGWLKWTLAVAVLLISTAGTALLVMKQEHRRRRSRWMLASMAAYLVCTLVSLIAGFPAPGI